MAVAIDAGQMQCVALDRLGEPEQVKRKTLQNVSFRTPAVTGPWLG